MLCLPQYRCLVASRKQTVWTGSCSSTPNDLPCGPCQMNGQPPTGLVSIRAQNLSCRGKGPIRIGSLSSQRPSIGVSDVFPPVPCVRQDGKNTLRGPHPFEPLIILWVVRSIKNRPWLFRDPFCKERVCELRARVEGKDSSSVRRHGSTFRNLERVVIELAPMRRCASSPESNAPGLRHRENHKGTFCHRLDFCRTHPMKSNALFPKSSTDSVKK